MDADIEKPPDSATSSAEELSRRKFFERLSIALFGFGSLILLVPMVGFVVAPLFKRRPEVWRKVGAIDAFKIGTTTAVVFEDAAALPWSGVASKTGAWLRRVDQATFIAFSVNCTHLGCPVRWLQQAELFMCPCHGGVYYQDGAVAAGPPPQPLPRYQVRVRNRQVEIRTNPTPITR
jgi:menaquinol-cytochrome c reductase iron-sulfur subunit